MAGRARWLTAALVVVGAVAALGCGVVQGPLAKAPAQKPAKPPADLCALVGTELAAQLVPDAAPGEPRSQEYSYSSYASCLLETDDEKAGSTAAGRLELDLTREGSTYSNTAAEKARDTFDTKCESQENGRLVTDLGDRGCLAVTEEAARRRVQLSLVVLLGADVLEVDYLATPTTTDRATEAARAVAANVLAAVP